MGSFDGCCSGSSLLTSRRWFSQVPPTMITYDLVGVVNHLGTMNGGHYVAYVRRGTAPPGGGDQWEDEKWFYASDRTVKQVPFDEVTKCVAYMLFYTRRGGDGPVEAAAAAPA